MIIETPEGLKILKGTENYEALLINSSRIDECIKFLYDHNLRNIQINSYHGYDLRNLDFLKSLAEYLEGITVLETHFDYTIINTLHKLKYLGIPDNGRDTIDLTNFPNLEICATEFSARLKGLENAQFLKEMTLSSFKSKSKDLSDLPELASLEQICLIRPNITSLNGIGKFKKLSQFNIFMASKLEKIYDLGDLAKTLQFVEIQKCKKIVDFESLGRLTNIKKIIISESGKINTLSFIKQLPKIEHFVFWDTDVLDSDLSYCEGIPYVGYDNKKHYSHKLAQVNNRMDENGDGCSCSVIK